MNFSLENLEKLTAGDLSGKKRFVKLFILEMKENQLPALIHSIHIKDIRLLIAKAHSIKSNARFFGLDSLTERLQKIEDITSLSISPELTEEVNEISVEISSICLEMDEWCNTTKHE